MDILWYSTLGILILIVAICVFLAFQLSHAARERRLLKSELDSLRRNAGSSDLKALESTLSPHLFRNILNSIQSHAYQTHFALDRLSSVLDYILYDSRGKLVTPKEEIAFAMNLIEINKIKVSPLFEFKVKMKIDEEDPVYLQKVLAPLISINLIENAFKHADLQNADSFITISFELKNGVLVLIVANKISSRQPLQKDRGGIGSATLEQRLKLIYGNNYRLEKVREGETYVASLKINLREHNPSMYPAG